MNGPLRILILEDRPLDAELVRREMAGLGLSFSMRQVTGADEFKTQLREFLPDLILADYMLPGYDGLAALSWTQATCPEVPFIFVSGALGEETAIEALHHGATDYVLKDRLNRLIPAVRRALREVEERTQRRLAEAALRNSEELLRAVVENAPDGVFVQMDGKFAYVSGPAARLFGVESAGELFGQTVLDRFHRDEHARVEEQFRSLGEQRPIPRLTEVKCLRTDGGTFEVEISAVPFLHEGKTAALVFFRDVTERKRLEVQLRQAQKMEAVGQLAGGVAHDFNNILAAMLMHLGLLQTEASITAEMKVSLKELESEVQRGARLTRQLLMFSRRQVLEVKALDLNQVLTELLKMLRRILGEDIQVLFQGAGRSIWIQADSGMMEQMLMNLAVNARDAMPKGGRLTISTRLVEISRESDTTNAEFRPGTFVCLAVADTGCGMEPAVLQRIFEPFFTTKEVGRGTGLGLATVHGIVRQHHGWIEVESEVDQGSTFRVFLPVLPNGPVPENQTALEEIRGGTETILLVEDELVVRRLAARTLRHFGYRVLEALNGREALQMWEAHRAEIQLLLTDVVMPEGMSGLELAERLKQRAPDLKVIVSSGYSLDMANLSEDQKAHFVYLGKPYMGRVLAATVRKCLDRR